MPLWGDDIEDVKIKAEEVASATALRQAWAWWYLKNVSVADGIPEVQRCGFESHGKELGMELLSTVGDFWKRFKQGTDML